MFAAMDNLQQPPAPPTSSNSAPGTHPSILDPRKQELLEARFMGSNQRMAAAAAAAAAGFNNQTQSSQPHYLHHSLTPHALPLHPHHSHSPQSMVQHQLQSSSSTSSNPSSSSPSIPPNGSPFSSMLSQQPPPSLQPQQSPQPPPPMQNQGSASLGAMMTTNSVPTGGSSFTSTSNNNSLNNLPNANNNSAGSTQSSCHYSAHSSSHNQDSNLSTTSAGSHCSDKQEPPIHCDTLHAHNLPPTPEKRSLPDPTTPTGANGTFNSAGATGSQRKRRKKDLTDPPPPPQERANSVGSKRGENKKVTDYFKVQYFSTLWTTESNSFYSFLPLRIRVLVDTVQLAESRLLPVHTHFTCTNNSRLFHQQQHFLRVQRRHLCPLLLTMPVLRFFTTIKCQIHLQPLRAGLHHCIWTPLPQPATATLRAKVQ